jgi:PAS domain S-box-containing protein
MNKISIQIVTILSVYAFSFFTALSQEYPRTQIKAAYIFQIPQYIIWNNTPQSKEDFKIGILGKNVELLRTLEDLSRKSRIQDKTVKIIQYNTLDLHDSINILYITEPWNNKIQEIFQNTEGRKILLITDQCENGAYTMINFKDNQSGNLEFEVNKINIQLEQLKIRPKLLLIGGTEVDISELFDSIADSLKGAKKNIFIKQLQLDSLNSQLQNKENTLKALNSQIVQQHQNYESQSKEIANVAREFSVMQEQMQRMQDSFLTKKIMLQNQSKKINTQKKVLESQKIEIDSQKAEITRQKEEIVKQQVTVASQKNKLTTQKKLIIIIAIMLALPIIMTIVAMRHIRISRQTNLKLQNRNLQIEHQSLEIRLQSRKLKKQAKKLKEQSDELKSQNKILEQRRNHLRALIDNIPDLIYIKDTSGRFTNANIRLVHHLGLQNLDDILNKTDFDFFDNDLASQFFADEQEICRTGKPLIKKEEPGIDSQGNILHMQSTKVPVWDSEGKIINIVGIGRDITKEKIAESKLKKQTEDLRISNALLEERTKKIEKLNADLQLTNEKLGYANKTLKEQKEELIATLEQLKNAQNQLIQTEKMASLGILTAGIAHEINNPINFVYAGVNSLKKDFDDIIPILEEIKNLRLLSTKIGPELRKIEKLMEEYEFDLAFEAIPDTINDIRIGAVRISEIVASLSKFSRLESEEWHTTNIHEEIESVLILLKNKYKRTIEIEKQYCQEMTKIDCYPGRINQVIMNIISNAIDAIGDKPGKITIRTSLSDNKIIIAIADSGKGMTEKQKSKIFDPFFTTKEVGKGIGLGLSISYSIIEEHNGKIYVNSTDPNGTEFIVELPVIQKRKKKTS